MIYWFKKYFTDRAAHWAAFSEVFVTAVFSLIPFAIALVNASARRADGSFISFEEIVGRGQIFLLCYAIYGVIFWLAFGRGDVERHGARIFLGVIATVITLPVVGLLGIDPTFSNILNPTLIIISYWLYGLLLLLNYLLLFYLNVEPPKPNDVLDREAQRTRDRYAEMKRDG